MDPWDPPLDPPLFRLECKTMSTFEHCFLKVHTCTTFRTNFQQIGHYFCISNVNTTQKVRPTNSPRKNSSPTHTAGAVEKLPCTCISKGGLYIESPTTYVSMRTLDATSFAITQNGRLGTLDIQGEAVTRELKRFKEIPQLKTFGYWREIDWYVLLIV